MKRSLYILAMTLSLQASSQSLCGTANEGSSVTLTAPAGKVFTSVTFASYGTPNGSCGSFTIGGCHASNSQSIVEAALLNKNSATINATNAVFGDPCSGTVKRLYIEAVYAFPLPLNLISFSCTGTSNSNILQWQTGNEINTKNFEVERSADGVHFSPIATVAAASTEGTNLYSYTDYSIARGAGFYRLKMTDKDGVFTYSSIIKAKASSSGRLTIFPNPVTSFINISGTDAGGYVEITTVQGTSLKRMTLTGSTQAFNMAGYPAGMYMLKYTGNNGTVYQKFIKQ